MAWIGLSFLGPVAQAQTASNTWDIAVYGLAGAADTCTNGDAVNLGAPSTQAPFATGKGNGDGSWSTATGQPIGINWYVGPAIGGDSWLAQAQLQPGFVFDPAPANPGPKTGYIAVSHTYTFASAGYYQINYNGVINDGKKIYIKRANGTVVNIFCSTSWPVVPSPNPSGALYFDAGDKLVIWMDENGDCCNGITLLTVTPTSKPTKLFVNVGKTVSNNPLRKLDTGQYYKVSLDIQNGPTTTALKLADALPTGITLSGALTATGSGTLTGCGSSGSSLGTNCAIAAGASGLIEVTIPISVATTATTGDNTIAVTGGSATSLCTTTTPCQSSVSAQIAPRLTITKQRTGSASGNFTFTFTGNNGFGTQTVATTAAQSVSTAAISLSSIGADTTVQEQDLPGWAVSGLSCSGVTGLVSSTASQSITIPGANLVSGKDITCTFSNKSVPAWMLGKRASVQSLESGKPFVFVVSAYNQSTSGNISTAGKLRDVIPAGVTVTSFSVASTWNCTSTPATLPIVGTGTTSTMIECSPKAALAPATSATDVLTINATLTATTMVTNTVQVQAGGGDTQCDQGAGAPARCRASASVSVGTPTVSGRVFLDNGTGSGVANDGILNGSEAPQAGIAVRLTDCAATPTVYASALTDGTGGYSFGVPASVAVNAPLCVEQTNSSAARISTGASVGATALPSGTATAATGGSYTYTRGGTPDRIAFAWNGTGHANLNFGDVDNSGFAASSAKTAQPGSTVTYAHTFSAGTAGQVRFGIASETATPALAGWSTQVFADPGCTGSLQPGAAQLYPPAGTGTAVAAGGKVCIVVKQFVPASAPQGANDKVTIRADFDYGNANPALSGSYVLDDITTVSDSVLELRKEVRNVTQGVTSFGVNNQAKSGDTLEYRITYTNNGAAPIGNMVVNDATPGYTSFVSATTGTTPATLTGCTKRTPANVAPNPAVACAAAQSAGGTGPIGWTFAGSVAPGGTGSVLFQVKID